MGGAGVVHGWLYYWIRIPDNATTYYTSNSSQHIACVFVVVVVVIVIWLCQSPNTPTDRPTDRPTAKFHEIDCVLQKQILDRLLWIDLTHQIFGMFRRLRFGKSNHGKNNLRTALIPAKVRARPTSKTREREFFVCERFRGRPCGPKLFAGGTLGYVHTRSPVSTALGKSCDSATPAEKIVFGGLFFHHTEISTQRLLLPSIMVLPPEEAQMYCPVIHNRPR